MIKELYKEHRDIFGNSQHLKTFFAPGRINLIGEHTDYNGGHVFPCALDIGTYAVASKRIDKIIRLFSKNFSEKGIIQFSLDSLAYERHHDWANYPKAVIDCLLKEGHIIEEGFDILFYGDIPNGAGLSSSASIELSTATAIRSLFDLDIDMLSMVKLCQRAENQFIGVNCGIMDQFAVGMGKKNCAILLNCNNIEYSYSELKLDGLKIVISNTNRRRGLKDSKYNERRDECNRALSQLQLKLQINSLGEMTIDEFEENKILITNTTDRKRAKHVVHENHRTIKAAKLLNQGKLEEFGRLMNESHISLRDDYDVTGRELDTLVELAWNQDGVLGSRMTGAGFGGCTVSLVKDEYIDGFIASIKEQYNMQIGYEPSFYVVEVGDGAREL